jgi:hypothetical protein
MLLLLLLGLFTLVAAMVVERSPADEPLNCVPVACYDLGTIICLNGKQQCAGSNPNTTPLDMGRDCQPSSSSTTLAYPITTRCVETLQPYDPSKIPSDCFGWICANWDGSGEATWCQYLNTVGHAGVAFRRLDMQCAPGEHAV